MVITTGVLWRFQFNEDVRVGVFLDSSCFTGWLANLVESLSLVVAVLQFLNRSSQQSLLIRTPNLE